MEKSLVVDKRINDEIDQMYHEAFNFNPVLNYHDDEDVMIGLVQDAQNKA